MTINIYGLFYVTALPKVYSISNISITPLFQNNGYLSKYIRC